MRVDLFFSLSSVFFKILANAITVDVYRLFLQADVRKRFARRSLHAIA